MKVRTRPARSAPADEANEGRVARAPTGAAADALTDALRRAEESIRKLGFGVYACVPIASGRNEIDSWTECLSFGKKDNRWGLYLESGPDDDPEHWSEHDLYSATIEKRVRAAKGIPSLVRALTKKHAEQLTELEDLTAALNSFATELPLAVDRDAYVKAMVEAFDEIGSGE